MVAKQTRQVGRFLASDEDGRRHTLIVQQVFVLTRTLDGHDAERPDIKSVLTQDGQPVNVLGKGEYEVITTGLRLHSEDPDAI